MPPKRSLNRKRQTKISFSPSAKPSPRATRVLLSSDDEDSSPARPSKRRRLDKETKRGMKLGMPVHSQARGMFGSSDNEITIGSGTSSEDEESEDEIQVVTPPKKTRRRAEKTKEAEESDEDEVQLTSRRRRTARRPSTPEEESQNEEQNGDDGDNDDDENEELKEDLAFLRSSPLPDRGRLRSTNTKPKSEREKALEALKKRRSGNSDPPSSATPGRKKPVVVESESDSDLEVIKEEQDDELRVEDEVDEIEDDEDDYHETNALDVFQENIEDENFIDDNDEGPLGIPAEEARLPLEFSGLSSAKPRELFKYAVEWMVQKKINPAFSSNDEIYTLAFRKLDDEVSGLANSKFHSSVWTADFTRAIRARPDLLVNELGKHMRAILEPHCEACNRKNHTATWEVALTGKPYHKDTLEPLVEDTDSSSDSDSDSSLSSHASSTALNGEKPTYDATGERLPPESKTFTLGSTCKANAQVAHTLHHWRYHLNSWVVDYLVGQGHCSPEKLVQRDKWSVRKRQKYANKIVDKMERVGEIRKLHRLYKEQVEFALEAKNEYHRGWGRTRG